MFDALQRRFTVASVEDSTSPIPRIRSVRESPAGRVLPLFLFPDGRLLAPIDGPLPDPTPTGTVRQSATTVILDSALAVAADLGTHPADEMVVRDDPADGFWYGEPTPFARRLLLAANDSAVFLSSGGPFEVLIHDGNGALQRILRIDGGQRPVNRDMKQRYRERVMAFATDPVATREWTTLSSDDVFPTHLPAFDHMVADRQGLLWLRRSIAEEDMQTEWIVVSRDGDLVARVRAPAALMLHDIDERAALGVWTDELQREQIHRYVLERGNGVTSGPRR